MEDLKEIVIEHQTIIPHLVRSVEHLVETQTETNKRLEEISKFLAKQAVFSTKIENMDRDLKESFKRVYVRIEEAEHIQKSDAGCNSVKLVNKDMSAMNRDISALVTGTKMLQDVVNTYPSSSTLKWIIGFILVYSIGFGKYTVDSITALSQAELQLSTLLKRNMQDTEELRRMVYGPYRVPSKTNH